MPPNDAEVLVKVHAVSLQVRRNQVRGHRKGVDWCPVPGYYCGQWTIPIWVSTALDLDPSYDDSSGARYLSRQKENVVPGSDCAGEIVAVGAAVKGWKKGDRVCANFSVDHISGDITLDIRNSGLGAPIDGVLTEYKVLPAHVRSFIGDHFEIFTRVFQCLVKIPDYLTYEEASTLP